MGSQLVKCWQPWHHGLLHDEMSGLPASLASPCAWRAASLSLSQRPCPHLAALPVMQSRLSDKGPLSSQCVGESSAVKRVSTELRGHWAMLEGESASVAGFPGGCPSWLWTGAGHGMSSTFGRRFVSEDLGWAGHVSPSRRQAAAWGPGGDPHPGREARDELPVCGGQCSSVLPPTSGLS